MRDEPFTAQILTGVIKKIGETEEYGEAHISSIVIIRAYRQHIQLVLLAGSAQYSKLSRICLRRFNKLARE